MKILFDSHMHVFSLARPALGLFLDSSFKSGLETLYSQVIAPEYLLSPLRKQGGSAIRNMLSFIENDPTSFFEIIEDDLAGKYIPKNEKPYSIIKHDKLVMANKNWDTWFLCPLIMDFGALTKDAPVYYYKKLDKSMDESVREMLASISAYRKKRPDGKLFIRPFLGMDPGSRGAEDTERLLHTYFKKYSKSQKAQYAAFKNTIKWKGDPLEPSANSFAGIKLYPPLGFNPWPDNKKALDATKIMYSFCEKKGIPLTVHCDDEGFRLASLEDSINFTNPESWAPVLAAYPELCINFGHFGERYIGIGARAKREWTDTIVKFMKIYPNVYTDVSFNGCEDSYWAKLEKLIFDLDNDTAEIVRHRIMFGTDFVVNLSKVRSYIDYVKNFDNSNLDRELKILMLNTNPTKFFFNE